MGAHAGGDNLYTDCVVALNPDTGELKWYFQEVPHDVWDWDAAYESVLLDLVVEGRKRKLLLNTNKGGYTFVVDRTDGSFVSAWPVAENINWITGVDKKGRLIGCNEPIVGESCLHLSQPSVVGDSGIRGRIHPAPVGTTRPVLSGARRRSPENRNRSKGSTSSAEPSS